VPIVTHWRAGYPVEVEECDLTERRMYVKVWCDAVQVMAPLLMAGYRSPFTGTSGADNPFISGGFALTNSETGCGAYALTPRMVAQVCRNGMTARAAASIALGMPSPRARAGRRGSGVITGSVLPAIQPDAIAWREGSHQMRLECAGRASGKPARACVL